MNIVNFEGLGIYLKLNKVAISLFGINIYWYAIFIVIAFILGIFLCKKDDGKYNIKFDDVLELLLFVIPISIISARLYFILFKLDYYIQNSNEILDIRNGGLAIYGGIIGAILTIVLFCKKKNINILDMCDYIAPYLPLGQAIGRWGNFFNSEAHGIETNSLFRMGIMENGNYIQVHPTFLYECICTFIIFVILLAKKDKRKYAGQLTYIYFFLYGIIRAFIEGLRTDSLMLGNFKISQILSIILSIVCGSILIYKRIKNKNE